MERVVGTGDFTHPAWFDEIRKKLLPVGNGLFLLNPDIAKACDPKVPPACRRPVWFMLVTEISNIYKKDGSTRKNHNLVFCPDIDIADRLRKALGSIGNVESDGRPILGLDARDLLEIVLTVSEDNYLVPAHIWTPWFSLLGSKSGFDSVRACFGDLTDHIFALETGLSSDPPMNRRVSQLDRYTLISNSDAHSPIKLGRECNRFRGEPGFFLIRRALESKDPDVFLGTVEFYPEEGKYHYDGHRKCNLRLEPEETRSLSGICPKCGKPLTLGVLYRVQELADRPGDDPVDGDPLFSSLIPLHDILSELLSVGPGSKKVLGHYQALLNRLGSEHDILWKFAPDILNRSGIPLLGEAVSRMRHREIEISPGYDGEFGKVRIFKEGEKERLLGQHRLFSSAEPPARKKAASVGRTKKTVFDSGKDTPPDISMPADDDVPVLNASQRQAVESSCPHILIIAGPGTGKTRTLTHRIGYLIEKRGVLSDTILAVTFTTKAANEMRERLEQLLKPSSGMPFTGMPFIGTFHALCYRILSEVWNKPIHIIDDFDRMELLSDAVSDVGITGYSTKDLMDRIVSAKQGLRAAHEDMTDFAGPVDPAALAGLYRRYQELLDIHEFLDFDDLIFKAIMLLDNHRDCRSRYRQRFCHLFIDEYQDLNFGQYRLMKSIYGDRAPDRHICAIGDPNQSIYGFRGSDTVYFENFQDDFPEAEVVRLTKNYRSTETILKASHQVIQQMSRNGSTTRVHSGIQGAPTIGVIHAPTETAEAVAVGKIIERMVGGTGFHAIDFDVVDSTVDDKFGFSDFAVLFRTGRQIAVFEDIFLKAGIPFQTAQKASMLKRPEHRQMLSCLKLIHGFGTFSDLTRLGQVMEMDISEAVIRSFRSWGLAKGLAVMDALESAGSLGGVEPASAELGSVIYQRLTRWRDKLDRLPVDEQIVWLLGRTKITTETPVDEFISEIVASVGPDNSGKANGFLAGLAMQTDTGLVNRKAEKVSLLSMHAAKGLEFPVVFISGCEKGLIPYAPIGRQIVDPVEERRLFYVAMTRAQSHLLLTWAKRRNLYGRMTDREPSPFVKDIDVHLTRALESSKGKQPKQKPAQLGLFV